MCAQSLAGDRGHIGGICLVFGGFWYQCAEAVFPSGQSPGVVDRCLAAAGRIAQGDGSPGQKNRAIADCCSGNEKVGEGFRGVPVTDINGTIIHGFDRPKIQEALKAANITTN